MAKRIPADKRRSAAPKSGRRRKDSGSRSRNKKVARDDDRSSVDGPSGRGEIGFPAGSYVRAVPVPPEVSYARTEQIFEKYGEDLRRIAGVLTVDIGLRYVGRRPTGEFAIRVHVVQKVPEIQLAGTLIPKQLEGIPVDVIERRFRACRASSEVASIVGGGRIAPEHRPSMFGTIGLPVVDTRTNRADRWMTCAHVVTGDRPVAGLGQRRWKVVDGDNSIVARSFTDRWVVDEGLDAAVLEPEFPSRASSWPAGMPRPSRIGRLTRQDVIDRVALLKYGAKTGLSIGEADSVQSLPIPIEMPDGSVIWARNQVQVRATDGRPEFAMQGDSGSAVLRGNPRGGYDWVGLLRAIDDEGFGIACHADSVAAKLGVAL